MVTRFVERAHYSRLTVDDSLSDATLKTYLETLDGNRHYFLQSDIAYFARYKTTLDDSLRTRRHGAGLRHLPAVSAAGPAEHRLRDEPARQGAGLHGRRGLRLRPGKAALGRDAGRNAGPLAPAREERRPQPAAGRQDLAGNQRHPPQALPAGARPHQRTRQRRRVRDLHELLRADARPALQLPVAQAVGGIQDPDEPVLPGHRRVPAAGRRFRPGDERDPRRPGGDRRPAEGQRPDHGRGPGQQQRDGRRGRLAAGRRGAADPRPERHQGEAADPGGRRRAGRRRRPRSN